MAKPTSSALTRFEALYIPEPMSGCWLWTGYYSQGGYGRLKHDRKPYAAHRLSYELHKGQIPEGLWVLHKCDNPACVNPDHLYAGTHADNVRDAVSRNRVNRWNGKRKGEANPFSKLTEDDVRSIRTMLADGIRSGLIAKHIGLPKSTIQNVIHGRTWTWLK